jgi:3-oxoacyl-[acyl-carrier protein] reductase
MQHAPARIVLVTGGSAGIGADVAQHLTSTDTHVVVNYRANAERAESIARTIRTSGGHASTLRADISDDGECTSMIDTIAARFRRLDALILNATVGVELGAHPGYAMRLNREAQRRMALKAVPLMPAGGRIVFVTNHQAHFFPYKAVPKGHTAVAASRRAGEATLHAMRPEFHRAGVHFTVISGDMTDPMFAEAIVGAVNTPNPSSVVCVRGPDHLLTA